MLQKLQFAKAESDREIASLNNTISNLEKRLSMVQSNQRQHVQTSPVNNNKRTFNLASNSKRPKRY